MIDETAPLPNQKPVSAARLHLALDGIVRDSLKPVSLGLGLLYVIFTLSHLLVLKGAVAGIMGTLSGASALFLLSLHLSLRRIDIATHWAHPLGAIIAGTVLINSLVHLYLAGDPLQTTNLILLLIGVGFLFLSTRWFAVVVAATVGGWGIVMQIAPTAPGALHFGFALLGATVLAGLIHVIRFGSLRRLEEMRIVDQMQKDELARALRRAETASRAKSQFLANMSHELRTPLNAIIGYSEMLQEELKGEEANDAVADLENIEKAGHHLRSLIGDVLDMAKIEADRVELVHGQFDVDSLIDDVVAEIRPLAEENGNEVLVALDEGIGDMFADEQRVRQCLYNLLSNAAKFTRQGRIEIGAKQRVEEGERRLYFQVRDTGIGMENSHLDQVFEPFAQVDGSATRTHGGSGLGLPITRHLTRLMGGDVHAESEPGKGSVFYFHLPMDMRG